MLATNIAETSLTVPRIRYVVDSGLARVSRYGTRHRVQSLGVEPIAQANAVQRAGRCGRLAPGICVRLYSEEDFAARPAFTEPEILRTGLAGVLLRLEALRLGPIDEFPFIDAPPKKAVADAYQLLHLLGAVDDERRLTKDGELMARLPVDPRVARLLVVANRNDALREGLVIAAALSVVDPREYGVDPDAARRKHEAFADARSEFTSYLNLWTAYRRERRGGERALRSWAKEHYLSAARLREWHDVHDQLHELVQGLRWRTRQQAADYRAIHQAVLAAFIDFIAGARRRARLSRHARVARAALRRHAAREEAAALARRGRARRDGAAVLAHRRAGESALGVARRAAPRAVRVRRPAVGRGARPSHGARGRHAVRPDARERAARRLRARRAEGSAADLHRRSARGRRGRGSKAGEPEFLAHNRAVRRSVLEAEARLRKRDLFVGEAGVAAFYDERLPPDVHDRASLASWSRPRVTTRELCMTVGDVAARDPGELAAQGYRERARRSRVSACRCTTSSSPAHERTASR